ncbi:uncharacterized protein [Centruroides vittatus]|uniref:uncharacterized protein n=1 Tax=Centruroides vittatus TaxID=120091 RepID=UPI00350F140C
MAGAKRLRKELTDLQKSGMKTFTNIEPSDDNILLWEGLIVPDQPPYNKGAFRIEISFPAEYPFKPPKITFLTQIYHPNIDENGQVCLPIISPEHWKPATRTDQVIYSLLQLIDEPEPEHPLRADIAEEYIQNKNKFLKHAEEFTEKSSEPRPTDLKMAGAKRLQKELADLQKSGMKTFTNIEPEDDNILVWQGLVVPDEPPFNKGAFRIEISFPAEYPFKPPKITFLTQIYHPNIDENGQVCLPIISPEHWKPATRTDQVIYSLLQLINEPEPEHPLRADLAEEYTQNKNIFLEHAEEFTEKFSEPRPVD